MRILALGFLLLLAAPANAQGRSPFAEVGLGPMGVGVGVRVVVGTDAQGLSPVARLTFSGGEVASEYREGQRFEQGMFEVGLGVSGTVDVVGPVALGGGTGLAVALAVRNELDDEPSAFDVPGIEVGLTLPVEVSALVRVSEQVTLSVTGYRSVPLGTATSQEPTPEARERFNPELGQWGAALGVRFGL